MQDNQFLKNPADDFLSGLHQNKAEMENKIANISAVSNWPAPVFSIPQQGSTMQPMQASTELPQGFDRSIMDAQLAGSPYKNLNFGKWKDQFWQNQPSEWSLASFDPNVPIRTALTPVETGVRWASENIQQWGQQIADIAMQHAQNVTDKGYNQWYIDLGQKIKAKHPQYSDISDEELWRKIVAKYPQYQDIVDAGSGILSNPISGSLASVESGLAKWAGGMFWGISNIGSAPLQDTGTAWVVRLAKWAMETGLWSAQIATSVMPTALGAKALIAPTVNTLFSTDTAGKVLNPISEWIGTGIAMWQEALGYDPESSVSKDIQGIGSTAGTIALLGWAQKWASKGYDMATPYVKWAIDTATPYVKKVGGILPAIPKAGNIKWSILWEENVGNTGVDMPNAYQKWKDLIFGSSSKEDLAWWAIRPSITKSKSKTDMMNSNKVALEWLQQLHNDKTNGVIEWNIGTMPEGLSAMEEARQIAWKTIWDLTNNDAKVTVSDIAENLRKELENPINIMSWPIKSIWDDLIKMASHESFKDGISLKDIQETLSNVSSQIRNSPELRNALQGQSAGRAVWKFLDELSTRFDKTLDETTGNSTVLKEAKAKYKTYMKVLSDFTKSTMVDQRLNPWQSSFIGNAIATAELFKHWPAGIPVALGTKWMADNMKNYKSRSWNYEKLMRTLDREFLNNQKNGNTNSVNSDPLDMAWSSVKKWASILPETQAMSNIPWSRKTTVEVPMNPLGNISKTLAKKQWVMVDSQGETKLLPSGDRMRQAQVKTIEKELNTSLLSKYNPNKPEVAKTFIEKNISQGKITREEWIAMVEKLYEDANWFQKPHYEKILEDLYSNKKIESFDDLINESKPKEVVQIPRDSYIQNNPKGMYEEINRLATDKRYSPEKANELIAIFKEKTGWDLIKDWVPQFDVKWNIIKWADILPNPPTNAKQQVSEPNAGDTIPEGYFRNMFWEIIKKPSNKTGGFIKIPWWNKIEYNVWETKSDIYERITGKQLVETWKSRKRILEKYFANKELVPNEKSIIEQEKLKSIKEAELKKENDIYENNIKEFWNSDNPTIELLKKLWMWEDFEKLKGAYNSRTIKNEDNTFLDLLQKDIFKSELPKIKSYIKNTYWEAPSGASHISKFWSKYYSVRDQNGDILHIRVADHEVPYTETRARKDAEHWYQWKYDLEIIVPKIRTIWDYNKYMSYLESLWLDTSINKPTTKPRSKNK